MTRLVSVDEACELVTDGTHYTPRDIGRGIPFLTVKDVSDTALDFSNCAFISEDDFRIADRANSAPKKGDVLFSKDGTVGKVHVVKTDKPFAVLSSLAILRPHAGRVDADYLAYALRSPSVLSDTTKKKTGSAVRRVILSDLRTVQIPLPPLPEQRRIAEILDKADALRAKRRAALAQLDTLTQSIFLDMFGDPIHDEGRWPLVSVADLCQLVRGSSPRPQGDPRFFGGPVPRLMVADITRDGWLVTPAIDSLTVEGARRSRPVPAGTLVMAVSGNVGLVSKLAIDACIHDGFVAFTKLDASKCESDFLLALMHFSQRRHEKHKAGAIFINLTTTDIKAMRLPLPPVEFQREFTRRIAAVSRLRTAHCSSLAELNSLFESIQSRGSLGEL